jgi:PTH2 family peptidyl-tRNA hydrolase
MRYKQVILLRADLKMSLGKACAQVAHASLGSAERARKTSPRTYQAWKREGQRKVVLRVEDEEELRGYWAAADKKGLPCYLVTDAGLTELPPETVTALGIGPDLEERIDAVTGDLKLMR